MNKLILLRGIPASGKSTFIKENGLEQYTINVDKIRLLFKNPITNYTGEKRISQKNDKEVWKFVYALLKRRFEEGDTTIVDATHCDNKYIERYKNLTSKYGYDITVVDFKIDILKALENNKNREEYKFVPEDVIEKMYEKLQKQTALKNVTYLSKKEFIESIDIEPVIINTDKYDRIIHIGDIHGCYTALENLLQATNYKKEKNLYIFCGDYLDRGIENKEVLDFLLKNYKSDNMIFLEGNHEIHLRKWVNNEISCSNVFEDYTKKEISNFNKKEVKQFVKTLKRYFYYEFNNKKVFVSHGGVNSLSDLYFMSSIEAIKGIGNYRDVEQVESKFEELHKGIYQVHGHRNVLSLGIKSKGGRNFNLEGKVEFGKYLRAVILDKNGRFIPIEIKNDVIG